MMTCIAAMAAETGRRAPRGAPMSGGGTRSAGRDEQREEGGLEQQVAPLERQEVLADVHERQVEGPQRQEAPARRDVEDEPEAQDRPGDRQPDERSVARVEPEDRRDGENPAA